MGMYAQSDSLGGEYTRKSKRVSGYYEKLDINPDSTYHWVSSNDWGGGRDEKGTWRITNDTLVLVNANQKEKTILLIKMDPKSGTKQLVFPRTRREVRKALHEGQFTKK
jgi:hypothetical protein